MGSMSWNMPALREFFSGSSVSLWPRSRYRRRRKQSLRNEKPAANFSGRDWISGIEMDGARVVNFRRGLASVPCYEGPPINPNHRCEICNGSETIMSSGHVLQLPAFCWGYLLGLEFHAREAPENRHEGADIA
jgi:hypothetical protein